MTEDQFQKQAGEYGLILGPWDFNHISRLEVGDSVIVIRQCEISRTEHVREVRMNVVHPWNNFDLFDDAGRMTFCWPFWRWDENQHLDCFHYWFDIHEEGLRQVRSASPKVTRSFHSAFKVWDQLRIAKEFDTADEFEKLMRQIWEGTNLR